MKKTILFFLFVVLFIHLDAQMLITTSQMNNINSTLGAFEGQIYKNTETNIFYIGLSGGTLKTIGELNTISSNATLTGNGTAASPLGLAQLGATNGQVLVWNGTSWIPSNAAPATTTVSNAVTAPNSLTTTVNGVTGNSVNMITGVSNNSSNNTISTTVNGITGTGVNIVNSIQLELAGNLLVSRVNGIGSTAITLPTPDGSETKINSGNNTTVLGSGTVASPYTINVPDASTTLKGVIQLVGDLTGTAINPQIAANAVTYSKMQNVTGQRLLGNPTTSAAAPSEISLGSGLTFSGTTLNTVNNGTVTNVTGTSPIVITTPSTTPNISINRYNIVAGTSSGSATNPLVLTGGITGAVVGGSNATLTVNNTAPLWNANELQGRNIATTAPSNGQALVWDGTNWTPTNVSTGNTTMQNSSSTIVYGDGVWTPFSVEVRPATSTVLGGIRLTGDLDGTDGWWPIIRNGAVTNLKLGANAVTTDKIQDGSIATEDLGSGVVTTDKIANNNVTLAKLQQIPAQTLIGNPLGSTATPTTITLGTGLSFNGSVLNATQNTTTVSNSFNGIQLTTTVNGVNATPVSLPLSTPTNLGVIQLTGDLTGSAYWPVIGNGRITYPKIQDVNPQRILGNPTGSAAAPSEIQLGTGLSFSGNVLNVTGSGWSLTGNAGTNPSNNFVGTTDAQRLVFRTSNSEKMTILTNGNVGINTTNPQNKLEITQGTAGNSGLRFTNLPNAGILATNSSGDVIIGTDIKDHHISRANSTANVAPTSGEIANPVNGYTAKVKLNNGIIEYWTYTSGAWVLNWSETQTVNGVDIGYIVGWTSNVTPPDYLLPLTGGTYNWSDFPHLQSFHASFPCQYIASSTATTFTLVNINTDGRFLRGGSTAGVTQNGSTAMPINPFVLSNYTHNHSFTNTIYVFSSQDIYNGVDWPRYNYSSEYNTTVNTSDDSHTHNISGGDSETRPINSSVVWCIKVKPTSTTGNITINNNTLSETTTNLTQNTTTGQITYTNENSTNQTAQIVSSNANNSIQIGTDGGAYYQKKVFEAYDNTTNSQNITQNPTTLNINTIRLNTGSIYTLNNDEITISEDGIFRITYTAGLYYSSNSYINGQFWLEINSSAYSGTYLYLGSRSNTYTCASKSVILQLSSGNTIRVRHQRFNTNLNTIPQCTSINIEKLN